MLAKLIKNPVTTAIIVLFFVILGIFSMQNMVIQHMPDIDFPVVSVRVVYPGASSEDIENQIVKTLEDAVSEVSDINDIISYANENYALIVIQFNLNVNPDIKSVEVKDRVEAVINRLPDGAEKPVITKYDVLGEPIVNLALYGADDEGALYKYADRTIRDRMSVIKGVANVRVHGGRERQINIELDSGLMRKNYVGIMDVIAAVSYKNMNVPGGTITRGSKKINVRLVGEYDSLKDIRNTNITTSEGASIRLSDIAEVKDGYGEIESIAGYKGKKAAVIGVLAQKGGDEAAISREVQKQAELLREELPDGMKLDLVTDKGSVILAETLVSYRNIILGILLAFVLLYFMLADLRAAVIASIVIPTSIISTFFFLDLSGFTVNMLTLMAFVTALGTLIANALVVIENVSVHMERGDDRITAAVNGTKEVAVSVFAAAGTNLVVFTPIAFVEGIIGRFLSQYGLTVVYASLFSLLASFTLTPMLCALFLKTGKKKKKGAWAGKVSKYMNAILDGMVNEYRKIFDWIFSNRWKVIGITVILAVLAVLGMSYVGGDFLPHHDSSRIEAGLKAVPGTSVERTAEIMDELEEFITSMPEVKNMVYTAGGYRSYEARASVNLVPVSARKRSDTDIMKEIIPFAARIPGADITVSAYNDLMGGTEYDISFVVYGRDYEKLRVYAAKIEKILRDHDYFMTLETSDETPAEEIRFIPDPEKMRYYGIMNAQAGAALRAAINGNDSAVYRDTDGEYSINISLAGDYKKDIEDIKKISVVSKKGLIPLEALGDISRGTTAPTIKRRNKSRIIQFDGFLYKGSQTEVQRFLESKMDEIGFEEGYGISYVGMSEMMIDSMKSMMKAMLIATILTFMLLAAMLNSLKTPLTIAASVLTSFVTVGFFLFFTKFGINMGSLVASIMMVGLAVNNSILLLDYTIHKLREGMQVRDALWEGVKAKFRIILMSTAAIMAGVLPSLFDPNLAKSSMASVILGGMIGSWVFTFFLTPVVFEMTGCHKRLCRERENREPESAE
ncbi:MAG: efflux RND transporter permease subunit [Candidatus Goldiibacteriota bacterium]